jgi:2,3-bisphosphoglycerate-dependent phosphoglycerate mutase
VTRLILIRHGESQVTVDRVIGGHRTCNGLSDLGRTQAARLRDRLAAHPEIEADVLIASHYPRARETAEIIAPGLAMEQIDTWDGFGEHDPGPECDGMTYDAFGEKYGSSDWSKNPYSSGFPGGETVGAFHDRIAGAISDLLETHPDQTVVVACHAGVIGAAMRHVLRAPQVGQFEMFTKNTSLTEMQLVRPDHWRLLRYNDHAHLAGLPTETPPVPPASPTRV